MQGFDGIVWGVVALQVSVNIAWWRALLPHQDGHREKVV